jgi:1-acyl-sn-glycerol-3-phosphate acyltransferase
MASRLMQWLHGEQGPKFGADPGEFDAAAVDETLRWVGPVFGERSADHRRRGYFDCSYEGFENIPDEPVMVVMNHSGGTTIPDVWGFVAKWYRTFGSSRPIHAMAHDMIFSLDATGAFFAKRGVMHATRAACLRALMGYKRDVLVLPGGDRETWRPWSKRFECDFSGRTGYVRMAMEAGSRIVPVSHAGAHETLMVLSDGHRFARAIGLHRIARAEIFPVHLSLPWGLAVGPWPHFPLPAAMRYRVGEPIETRWDGSGHREDWVHSVDGRVRAEIQKGLDVFAQRAHSPAPHANANETRSPSNDAAHEAAGRALAEELVAKR